MRISLITQGDPAALTGGHLFHRRLAERATQHGASLGFISFPDLLFPIPALWGPAVLTSLNEQRPDVVVVDSIATAFTSPWSGRIDVPIAAMAHQPPGGIDHGRIRSALQTRLDVHAYRSMDLIMVAAQSLIDEFRELGSARISLVAPGRDPTAANGDPIDLRRGRGTALLCIGNWVPRKGIVELLRAFALLPATSATLHLVGDDAIDRRYARRVRALVTSGPLAGRVVVHGAVPQSRVSAMYRAADAFVLPSFREPYGTVYGEAMAFGLPVVGWQAGNLPYLADDGVEGFIVGVGDIRALAHRLLTLCDDPGLRDRMGEAARRRAAGFPTWDETADAFYRELRELVTKS